ncbi:MAG: guanylate kinase [Ruminococcus sp.]|jgi:guanylate kinase|uniref:Guanylate kinase n=1 Tax=Ruminococcus flavefaciens TaxID=1265 RepID=A0A1K1NZK5_RUMFL|nr:guanylate kinase [Ruminococcus flavefaciens]MBQ6034682.1 guanylate kinase [Ruminococcus sp.]SFW40759.1 guanylate kinase [Ruminococcus flavefaciens]
MNKGRLIVFSAPSGCGKGTMLEEILKDKSFAISVSATTRAPREGEKDGVNYHFLTREDFEQRIADGKFIEHAEYCQNLYGTLSSEVDGRLEQGLNVILEIEPQGAMKIREKRPDAVFIFVVPPSINELRRRLKKRGTETDEVIEERVSKAAWEISQAEKYDYVIVNDALEDAVSDFFAVIRGEQLKVDYSGDIINEVLKNA